MIRHRISITISVLTLAIVLAPGSLFGQDTRGVTGVGKASLPAGASLSGVSLSGMLLAMAVYIPGDGTAAGDLEISLAGTSLLGQPQTIEITGKATNGTINVDGTRTFSGTATVDMGDGTAPLTAVPFSVIATATGITLSVAATTLPAATLTSGVIQLQ
jgi:hypothetical protein